MTLGVSVCVSMSMFMCLSACVSFVCVKCTHLWLLCVSEWLMVYIYLQLSLLSVSYSGVCLCVCCMSFCV